MPTMGAADVAQFDAAAAAIAGDADQWLGSMSAGVVWAGRLGKSQILQRFHWSQILQGFREKPISTEIRLLGKRTRRDASAGVKRGVPRWAAAGSAPTATASLRTRLRGSHSGTCPVR